MSGAPSKYDPSYCDAIITHCADGSSLTSFAASIDVCRDTISQWVKTHPEFSVAAKAAKAKAAAWWEEQGRQITKNGGGNATLAIFGMKNMGGDDWSDTSRQEHSGPNGQPIKQVLDVSGLSDATLRELAKQTVSE
jgi:hypothetical protein